MAIFVQTLNPTSFGFFDSSQLFQWDSDKMVTFVLRSLGEDILGVELTKKMIWNFFENSTREFQGMIIEYQARSNLASLLGMPTGSIDGTNGLKPNSINLTNVYVRQNLELLDRMSEAYSSMIGLGGIQDTFSGSITLELNRQDYNLYTELKDDAGNTLFGNQTSGFGGKLQIYEVFHTAPIQYAFNGTLVNNFVGVGASAGSSVTDARFHVLPVFEDVLRAGMLKAAQKVRRSHYSYKITGKMLRLFPVPTSLVTNVNDKLWIRCGYRQQPLPSLTSTLIASGTLGASSNPSNTFVDDTVYGVSNPANVPFGIIDYNSLNPWARNWIAQHTLASCKELVGEIRSKFKTIPIPGAEVSLNGEDLIARAREDKEKLMTGLKEKLEALSYDKLAEVEASKAEQMVKQLQFVPMPAKAAIIIA